MTLVLDASVILKWLLQDPSAEPDTAKALAIMERVVEGRLEILQPMHWLAEVAAVAARLKPDSAARDVELLASLEFATSDEVSVMRRATIMAIDTNQHLFDTLYHAVALEHAETTLVTADDRYRRKAEGYGRIRSLHAWTD
jgi:predicted nucleic acid-binding protein